MKSNPAQYYGKAYANFKAHRDDYFAASAWFFLVCLFPIAICLLTPLTLILTIPLFMGAVLYAFEVYCIAVKDNVRPGFAGVRVYYFRYFSAFNHGIFRPLLGFFKAVGFTAAITFGVTAISMLIGYYASPEFAATLDKFYSLYLVGDATEINNMLNTNVHLVGLSRFIGFSAAFLFTAFSIGHFLHYGLNVFMRPLNRGHSVQGQSQVYAFGRRYCRKDMFKIYGPLEALLLAVHFLVFAVTFVITNITNLAPGYSVCIALLFSCLLISFGLPFHFLLDQACKDFFFHNLRKATAALARRSLEADIRAHGENEELRKAKADLDEFEAKLAEEEKEENASSDEANKQ